MTRGTINLYQFLTEHLIYLFLGFLDFGSSHPFVVEIDSLNCCHGTTAGNRLCRVCFSLVAHVTKFYMRSFTWGSLNSALHFQFVFLKRSTKEILSITLPLRRTLQDNQPCLTTINVEKGNSCCRFLFFLFLCWYGVHCGIYKSLTIYQIHPLHHSPLSPFPPFLEWF
jgi:hypothetical protein